MSAKDKIKLIEVVLISGLIILFAMLFSSCDEDTKPKAPEAKRLELDSTSQYSDQNYRTYTLEGCQYVVVGYGKDRWGSHKGNCKNPIHNEKK